MLEREEVFTNCVIGFVDSLNEMPPNDNYKNYSTFVRLAGGAVTLRANGRADDLPAQGEAAIFQVQPSRSGSVAQIVSWGWLVNLDELYSGAPQVDVEWVKNMGRGGFSAAGGHRRSVAAAAPNGKR